MSLPTCNRVLHVHCDIWMSHSRLPTNTDKRRTITVTSAVPKSHSVGVPLLGTYWTVYIVFREAGRRFLIVFEFTGAWTVGGWGGVLKPQLTHNSHWDAVWWVDMPLLSIVWSVIYYRVHVWRVTSEGCSHWPSETLQSLLCYVQNLLLHVAYFSKVIFINCRYYFNPPLLLWFERHLE